LLEKKKAEPFDSASPFALPFGRKMLAFSIFLFQEVPDGRS
jgi:hypothetical protein